MYVEIRKKNCMICHSWNLYFVSKKLDLFLINCLQLWLSVKCDNGTIFFFVFNVFLYSDFFICLKTGNRPIAQKMYNNTCKEILSSYLNTGLGKNL